MPVLKSIYRSQKKMTVEEFERGTGSKISAIDGCRTVPDYKIEDGDVISIVIDSVVWK